MTRSTSSVPPTGFGHELAKRSPAVRKQSNIHSTLYIGQRQDSDWPLGWRQKRQKSSGTVTFCREPQSKRRREHFPPANFTPTEFSCEFLIISHHSTEQIFLLCTYWITMWEKLRISDFRPCTFDWTFFLAASKWKILLNFSWWFFSFHSRLLGRLRIVTMSRPAARTRPGPCGRNRRTLSLPAPCFRWTLMWKRRRRVCRECGRAKWRWREWSREATSRHWQSRCDWSWWRTLATRPSATRTWSNGIRKSFCWRETWPLGISVWTPVWCGWRWEISTESLRWSRVSGIHL